MKLFQREVRQMKKDADIASLKLCVGHNSS